MIFVELNRHKKNAKKRARKRGWANAKAKKSSLNEDESKKDDNDKEPITKRRRLNGWMRESDLFHHKDKDKDKDRNKKDKDEQQNQNQNQKQIDDTEIEQKIEIEEGNDIDNNDSLNEFMENDDDDDDDDDEVPQEVIELFEKAIMESSTQKEFEDKWKKIMEEQSAKYSNLAHKFDKYDKFFVDGFQIEVDGVYRLNLSALKRSLRMKHFSSLSNNYQRVPFNRQMSYGSMQPSFGFVDESVNRKYDLKHKQFKPTSFWGKKIKRITKVEQQDQLQKWLDY